MITMQQNTDEILKEWQLNPAAAAGAVDQAMSLLKVTLPQDYVRFLGEHNGGEGFIGENYLILWRVEELEPYNREYEVNQNAPGLILFGSNGGGEAYAFDSRGAAMKIVRVPFVGMELQYAQFISNEFDSLWVELLK